MRSDWLQTAPGLKPKGEWKPLSATYNGEDPGSGERFASPGPEEQSFLTRRGSAFTLLPPFFKGRLSFAQVENFRASHGYVTFLKLFFKETTS